MSNQKSTIKKNLVDKKNCINSIGDKFYKTDISLN